MAAFDKADTSVALKTAMELYHLEEYEMIWEERVVSSWVGGVMARRCMRVSPPPLVALQHWVFGVTREFPALAWGHLDHQ